MNGRRGRAGVALVAAMLTLAAIAALALANIVMVRLDTALAVNRQALALGRTEARSRLALFLLRLEAESQTGQFPESAPAMTGVVAYSRSSPTTATASVAGGEEGSGYRNDVSLELQLADSGWWIHIDQIR